MSLVSPTIKRFDDSKIATFAAGCFWGVEHIYRKHFGNKIIDVKVGYANGDSQTYDNPTYNIVKQGSTGFAEAVQISYNPNTVSYQQLVEFFFIMHDPTHLNHQGPDQGTQYRSGVFVNDELELKTAQSELEKAQAKWYPNHKIVTIIEKLKSFYDAEDYHQKYLINNPSGYACPSHFIRTTPKE